MFRRDLLKLVLGSVAAAGMSSLPLSRLRARQLAEGEGAYDCIIIGAGVSGLTAAYHLSDKNILVLEANDYPGGRALSGTYKGWSYPKGTEYLGEPEGGFAEMIKELDLDIHEIPYPMDTTFRDGKFYKGSGRKTALLIREGGLTTYNKFLRTLTDIYKTYAPVPDYDPSGNLARLDTITCRQWFNEMKLPKIYHDTYNVMARGLFGATLDEVSALGAFEEIAFDFEGAEKIDSLEDLPELETERSRSGSYTFTHGIAQFTTAVGDDLGDQLRLNAAVSKITGNDEDGYSVFVDGEELETDSLIIATPLPVTLTIASDILSASQADILKQVPYAPYVTAAVFSDEPVYEGGFDMAMPDDFFFSDLYDCTWVQRRFDKKAKNYPGYVASFYIAPSGYKDMSILKMSDEDLIAHCKKDLDRVFPGRADRIKGYDIHRHRYAYPVSTPGQFKRLTQLHKTLTGGMQLAGDGINYPTFQTAIMAGEVAAERIFDYLSD